MENWLIAVKILSGICALLIMLASWFGYDGYRKDKEIEATQQQVTAVANVYSTYYYYGECDK